MGNNRDLPEYKKSVGLQVTQQPDQEAAGSMMINAFRNFSEGAASLSQSYSKEQATQQREILKNNISNAYRAYSLEALKNPDQNAGLAGYVESSKQYAKQLIGQTDSFNKQYVNNLIDYYHNEHMYTVEKNAIEQNKRVASTEAYSRINTATADWKNAINTSKPMVDDQGNDVQFDSAKALFATQLKNMETDAQHGLIRPERLGDGKATLTKQFVGEMFLKRYEDHVSAGTGDQFIMDLRKPEVNIPGYSIEDKTKLIGQMIHIRDQGRSAANVAVGQIKSKMHDEITRVTKGGIPNTELQEQVKALDEPTYDKLMEDTNVAQHVYSATQAATYKSPEEVEQLKNNLRSIDPNDSNFGHLNKIADTAIKAIDLQTKQFKQNPMAEMLKDPALSETVNSYQQAYNSNSVGENLMNTPFNSQVPKPWNSIIQAQLHRGLTINGEGARQGSAGTRVRLLENSQVPGMVNSIMQSTPKQKIELMNKWNEEYGGGLAFNLVVKQLVDGGMPAQYALLANIDPSSKDAADVSEAVSVPLKELASELHKKDPTAVTAINNRSTSDVFGVSGGLFATANGTDSFKSFMNSTSRHSGDVDREYYNSISTTVQQLAYYYSLVGHLNDSDAVSKAENVIASRYDYAVINNQEIRIPHDTTSDIVKSYAAKLTPQVMTFPFDTKGYDKDYAKELIHQGHWKNDSADYGLVWVDVNGKLWNDKNGHPLSFSFDEAKTGIRHIETPPASKIPLREDNQIDQSTNPGLSKQQINQDEKIDRLGADKVAQAKRAVDKRDETLKAAIQGKL